MTEEYLIFNHNGNKLYSCPLEGVTIGEVKAIKSDIRRKYHIRENEIEVIIKEESVKRG